MQVSETSESLRLQIVEVPCPCCRSERKRALRNSLEDVEDRIPGRFTISQCEACAFVYLSATPPADQLPLCYPADYHAHRDQNRSWFVSYLYQMRTRYRAKRVRMHARPREIDRILELGCGDASLLLELENLWPNLERIYGTELNFQKLKLPVGSNIQLATNPSHLNIQKDELDLVILFEVLEHFPNPAELLRDLYSMMKPGARLVGSLPNFDSLWSRVFMRTWSGLQVPRHQMHFYPESLAKLLELTGFRLLRVKPAFDPGELAVCLSNVITQKLNLKTRPREAWFYIPLVLLMAPLQFLQYKIYGSSGTTEFVAEKSHDEKRRTS